jgi:hypothetical protein
VVSLPQLKAFLVILVDANMITDSYKNWGLIISYTKSAYAKVKSKECIHLNT